MSQVRFKYNNLVDAGSVYRYSSQLSGLPAVNVQEPIRLKVWQTEDGFTVRTAQNDRLPFRDSSTSALHEAVIASGTYAGSALASVIDAAMDAAGTYTGHVVVYNSTTKKFSLTKAPSATYLKLDFSRNQLMLRGNCESATPPYLTGETDDAQSNATFARSTAQKHAGASSFLFTKTNAAGAAAATWFHGTLGTTDLHGLAGSRTYTLGFWIFIPSGGMVNTEITLAVQDYISSWAETTAQPLAVYDAWQYVSVTRTMRAGCTGTAVKISAADTAALNETFYVDDVDFTRPRHDTSIADLIGFRHGTEYSAQAAAKSSEYETDGNEHEIVVDFGIEASVDSLIIDKHNFGDGTVLRYRLATSAAAFTNRWNSGTGILRSANIASWDSGLVWWLPFDEEGGSTVADNSGRGVDATVFGAAMHVPGISGRGIRTGYVADVDYVRAASNVQAIAGAAWSVEAWIKPFAVVTGANQYAVSNTRPLLGIDTIGRPTVVWNDTGLVARGVVGSVLTASGVWHHVVGTHSGTTTIIYVDSVPLQTDATHDSADIAAGQWYVGRHAAAAAAFKGEIDEVRVYSRALTQAEVTDHYENPGGSERITAAIISIEHTATFARAMQLHWFDRRNTYSQIGRLWAGIYFTPDFREANEITWQEHEPGDRTEQTLSEGGATLIDRRDPVRNWTIEVDPLDEHYNADSKSGFEDMLEAVGRHTAFYVSFDSNDLEGSTYYGLIVNDAKRKRRGKTAVIDIQAIQFREQK